MNKRSLYFVIVLVIAFVFFASCKSRGLIEKRRYSKGYYFGLSKGPTKTSITSIVKPIKTNETKTGLISTISESKRIMPAKDLNITHNEVYSSPKLDTLIKRKNHVSAPDLYKTDLRISKERIKSRVGTKLKKYYGWTCEDYLVAFIVVALAALYFLLVYGWMLLLAGILAISIAPVIPVGIAVFGILMAGLTLFGAYYLFNIDKNDKLEWWQVLLITELLIPAIAALVLGCFYLSTLK